MVLYYISRDQNITDFRNIVWKNLELHFPVSHFFCVSHSGTDSND